MVVAAVDSSWTILLPGELLPDTPETLPPAPIEPLPGPDDPGNVPVGA